MQKREKIKKLDGIEIDEECGELLETVFESGQEISRGDDHQDLKEAERAIDRLGEKSCTIGLIHVVERFSKEGGQEGTELKKQLANRAADRISGSRRREQKP